MIICSPTSAYSCSFVSHTHIHPGPDILGYFRSATEAYLVLNVHSVIMQGFSALNSLQMLRVILHSDSPGTGRLESALPCGSVGQFHASAHQGPGIQGGLHLGSAVGRVPGLGFSLPPPGPKNLEWPNILSLWCLALARLHIGLQKMSTFPGAHASQSPPPYPHSSKGWSFLLSHGNTVGFTPPPTPFHFSQALHCSPDPRATQPFNEEFLSECSQAS